MATTQKIGAIVKKTGLPRGGWHESGRVKGWGHRSEGYEIKAEVDEYYVCKVCYANSAKNESHRPTLNGRVDYKRCTSYSWRRRTTKTGRVFVTWHEPERYINLDPVTAVRTIFDAVKAEGFEAHAEGNLITIADKGVEV